MMESALENTMTNSFNRDERECASALLEIALREDLAQIGDITSLTCIPSTSIGRAGFVARQSGVLAGLPVCRMVMERIDPSLRLEPIQLDGSHLQPGALIAAMEGPMRSILAAERIALNFLQHLSGIASLTRKYVDALAGYPAKILDTRKTLPGWRPLEKYAVRMGGGVNHRMGLYDAILIKDNHLAALSPPETAIQRALDRCAKPVPICPSRSRLIP